VERLLDDLGLQPGDIAESLARAGVVGRPRDSEACALASYLHAVLSGEGAIRRVQVGTSSLRITWESPWRRRLSLPHPAGVVDFVKAFDLGAFPQLLRGSTNGAAASQQL